MIDLQSVCPARHQVHQSGPSTKGLFYADRGFYSAVPVASLELGLRNRSQCGVALSDKYVASFNGFGLERVRHISLGRHVPGDSK